MSNSSDQPELQQRNDTGENNNAISASLPQSNDPLADEGKILQPNNIPTLSIQTIIGIFDTEAQAQQGMDALKQAGYGDQQTQTLNAATDQPVMVHSDATQQGPNVAIGGVAGAIAGAAIVGLASVALPVAGTALAIGALSGQAIAAVGGAAVGGAVGATAGGYKGMATAVNDANDQANQPQDASGEGGFMVVLKIPNSDSPDKAVDILKQQGARETNVFGPAL